MRLAHYLRNRFLHPSGVRNDNASVIPSDSSVIPSEAKESKASAWINQAWSVFQTFVFITFTQNMVNQIGSAWNFSILPRVAWQHRMVLLVFVFGMIVHWLPDRWKRRYRIAFARLPLPVMALVVFLVVFGVYQFITADLQSFIYFQF